MIRPMPTPARLDILPAADYRARVLPLEEWQARVGELPYPPGAFDPSPNALLVVVEDATGRILASWGAMNLIMLEGLHVDPAHRHGPVGKHLFAEMIHELLARGVPGASTIVNDPGVAALAQRIGFVKIPGEVFQVRLTPPQE